VGVGRAILRGIKLAAYGFAALLVCLVIYDVMTLAPETPPPATPNPHRIAEVSSGHPGSATVPPPPPLPGQAKSSADRRRIATAKQPQGVGDEVNIREVDAAEVARLTPSESNGAAGSAPAEAPSVKEPDAPVAIVIVRPPVRPPQENRGLRWIKAVGRALHIGGDKDR
jgi:hypothetical protein